MGLEANTNWVKQTDFTFAACVAYLKSRIDLQDDPSTLVLQYRLFNELGDKNALSKVRHKIEGYIDNLVELQDSGFQMRDCLVVTTYANLNNWYANSPNKFEEIVLPRLRIAASSNWFDEPELVSSVFSIQGYEGTMRLDAIGYFTKSIGSWLKRDYLNGILHYALCFGSNAQIDEYLKNVDWNKQGLIVQSLALVYFQQIGYLNSAVQSMLADLLYDRLNSTDVIESFVNITTNPKTKSDSVSSHVLTDYEITSSLLALHEANLDEIVGLRNPKSIEFEFLVKYLTQIRQEGIFITRRYLILYEAAVFISLVSILIFLVQIVEVPDIGRIAGALVEAIVLVILLLVGAFLIRRKRPSEIVAKELLGIGDKEHE